MIYNRTYIDIINAKNIFTNKIQKFIELTEAEQNIIDKAYFNLATINRITNKIISIWDVLKEFNLVQVENDDVREWTEQEIFTVAHFSSIRGNIAEILTSLENLGFVEISPYQTAYNLLTNDYVYTNINNLEKLLYDIGEIFNRLVLRVGDNLYIFGSYNVTLNGEELYIE